jgi:hypothetical protein
MGLLDDAIREHLELKRRRGADPDEVARQEDEALGDPRSGEFARPAAEAEPELPAADDEPVTEEEPAADIEPEIVRPDEEPGADEDVLEETPDFLQETPEHDRLWFEQKPPRDFDFDN